MVVEEDKIITKRYDCKKGEWVKVAYTPSQLNTTAGLRRKVALKRTERVIVRNILELNGSKIVQYEREGKKCQCLFVHFRNSHPQQLIEFLLSNYNPTKHEVSHINEARCEVNMLMAKKPQKKDREVQPKIQ